MDDVRLEPLLELLEALEALPAEELVLDMAEDLLGRAVVDAVALSRHALDDARLLERLAITVVLVLLCMGSRKTRYAWETKVAAARAVVDEGMGKPEAMAAFGIASRTPLDSWCRLYREGGADALRPKPKGRPKGSAAQSAPKTREQELEARVRRLEAENAYLKKVRALEAEKSRAGRSPK